MIEVKNLVKVFKCKNKEKCIALNNVSFSLGSQGLVFVLGKSGSGKTTLLSLIGTLDNITSGDIIVDGISLKNINEKDASSYRNERIAFIYQDYHLIEELTVKENIALSLELKDENQDELIYNALKDVDLEGYGNRYPRELSGGEKQRVAIARAIVKSTPIILADEPTGNLDTKTTKQIFDLLSHLAKDKLILIVSHDLRSAEAYADKIINIQDGKLLNIVKRNKNSYKQIEINEDTLYVPQGKHISEEEQDLINTKLNNIKNIKWFNNEFITDNGEISDTSSNKPLSKHKLKNKETTKLGFRFFKKSIVSTIVMSIIMMLLVNVLGLTNTLANYNYNKVLEKELERNNVDSLVIRKTANDDGSFLSGGYPGIFNEQEVKEFSSLSLKGNAYECVDTGDGLYYINLENLGYLLPYRGAIISNQDFVNEVFNDGNEVSIKYNPVQQKYGFFITDFEADQFITFKEELFKSYDDFFKTDAQNYIHGYVNGIINTNYKTMFSNVLSCYTNGILDISKREEAKTSKRFVEFNDFANNFLIKKYTFNPNFKDDFALNPIYDSVRGYDNHFIYNGKRLEKSQFLTNYYSKIWNNPIYGNDIVISPEDYYSLTGIELTVDNYETKFKPIKVTLELFNPSDGKLSLCQHKEELNVIASDFRIVSGYTSVSLELAKKIIDLNTHKVFSLYYDDTSDAGIVLDSINNKSFAINNRAAELITRMTSNVNTFSKLFELIKVVLSSGILFLLVMVSLKSIKEQMHNIGILKSLGTRNFDLFKIFALKIFAICLFSSILYSVTASSFIHLADTILIDSQAKLASKESLNGLELIIFEPYILGLNILFIFLIGIVSFIIEAIRLRNIKPINIIKAKE